MKAVAEFDEYFARTVPVESPEGDAVVEFDAAVRYIDGVYGGGDALAEILSQSEVERGVLGQIISGIRLAGESIRETGAVINIGGSVGAPRQSGVPAEVERIALVVIERAPGERGKIGESAIDGPACPRNLIRIGEVNLGAVRDAG